MNTAAVVSRQLSGQADATGETSFVGRYTRFGAFHLDLQRQELFKNGERVRVPWKVYQVLDTLLERPGEIVTREALRARLWPADTHVNFEANMNTTVNKLRQVLGDSNEQSAYVQTIPRRGYSFIAKVEFADRPALSNFFHITHGFVGRASRQPAASERSSAEARRASVWFTAGVIALVLSAILLGAAITLFSHR